MPSARRRAASRASTGWYAGAKMKQNPARSRHRRSPAGSRSILTPSRSSTSAAPTRPLTARLPCLATAHAGRRRDQRRAGGDIERAGAVAAGAGGIEQRCRPSRSSARARARIARAAPVELRGRLALQSERDQKSRDQRVGRIAVEDLADHALRPRRLSSERPASTASNASRKLAHAPTTVAESCAADVCPRACRSIRDGTARPRSR